MHSEIKNNNELTKQICQESKESKIETPSIKSKYAKNHYLKTVTSNTSSSSQNLENEINIREKDINNKTKLMLTDRNSSRNTLDKFTKYIT